MLCYREINNLNSEYQRTNKFLFYNIPARLRRWLAGQFSSMFHNVREHGRLLSLVYPTWSEADSYSRIISDLWTVRTTLGIVTTLPFEVWTRRVPLATSCIKPLVCMNSRKWLICSSLRRTRVYSPERYFYREHSGEMRFNPPFCSPPPF